MEPEQKERIERFLMGADHWSDLEPMLDDDDIALLRIELDSFRPRRSARRASGRAATARTTRLAA